MFRNILWFQNIVLKTLKNTVMIRSTSQRRVIPIRKTSTKTFVIWQPQILQYWKCQKKKIKIFDSQSQIVLPPAADKFAKLDPSSVFAPFEHYPSSHLMCLGLCVPYLLAFFTCITCLWCLTFAPCIIYVFYCCGFRCDRIS